jgi:hypothetical protein
VHFVQLADKSDMFLDLVQLGIIGLGVAKRADIVELA